MAAQGFSIEEAKQVLGHGSLSMVLHYPKVYDEDLEKRVSRLGAARPADGDVVPLRAAQGG